MAYWETAEEIVEREWMVDGIPVLSAKLSLPRPANAGGDKGLRRIARYYRQFGNSYLRYCERFLYPQAATAFTQAAATGAPLPQFTTQLTHRVTWSENGLWSLYLDSRERGAVPLTVRRGDTWDLATGTPMPLSDFFPVKTALHKILPALAVEDIRRQTTCGNAVYREDWRKLVRRAFSTGNYYITPEGPSFFYQMYALAPATEGIPTFRIPWGTAGAHLPERFVPLRENESGPVIIPDPLNFT